MYTCNGPGRVLIKMRNNLWWLGCLSLILYCNIPLIPIIRSVEGANNYTAAQFWKYYCTNNGIFIKGSAYDTNLEAIVLNFGSNYESNISYYNGFRNLTSGHNADSSSSRVNAIGLCRGDLFSDSECVQCMGNASRLLKNICGTSKEAIGWQEDCMVRYSNRSILGTMETNQSYPLYNQEAVAGVAIARFNRTRANMLSKLKVEAARGNSTFKVAIGKETVPGTATTLYGIVQCTPDLNDQQCQECLGDAISSIPNTFTPNSRGGRVYYPSCNLRYENNSFTGSDYSPPVPASTPTTTTTSSSPSPTSTNTSIIANSPASPSSTTSSPNGKDRTDKTKVVIIVVVVTTATLLFVLVVAFFIFRAKRKAPHDQKQHSMIKADSSGENDIDIDSLRYDFATVRAATKDFHETNKLGSGGFGAVYKGVLPNGREIAVKRLERGAGTAADVDFNNEIVLVAKLQHRNLVRLLGFSLHGAERLLILEFVPKGSLDKLLFDETKRDSLNWETRFKIIGGVARGMVYLHEDSRVRIIHRDLKAANILLDEDLNPKIADFGTARLFTKDQTHADTNKIAGTYGYMAPEYGLLGFFSVKSDVYSFGVLLLEIILGRKSTTLYDGHDMLTMAWRKWCKDSILEIVDPLVLQEDPKDEILRCVQIGFLCVQEHESDRPTMSSVVLMLSGQCPSIPMPTRPPYVGSTKMDIVVYKDEDTTTETEKTQMSN